MRDAFDAARDQGRVNLAFMGANDAYWQIRLEDGGRTIVAYKSVSDPEPDVTLKTAMFREVGRRECELLGIQHQGASPLYWKAGDYTVPAGGDRGPVVREHRFRRRLGRSAESSAWSPTRSRAPRRPALPAAIR